MAFLTIEVLSGKRGQAREAKAAKIPQTGGFDRNEVTACGRACSRVCSLSVPSRIAWVNSRRLLLIRLGEAALAGSRSADDFRPNQRRAGRLPFAQDLHVLRDLFARAVLLRDPPEQRPRLRFRRLDVDRASVGAPDQKLCRLLL